MRVVRNGFSAELRTSPAKNSFQAARSPWEGKSMSRGKRVYNLIVRSRGQTMAEYALILATIALVAVALVGNGGTIVNELVNNVSGLLL